MKKVIIATALIALAGCKAINSTTGTDYYYENHAYVRSTPDIENAKVSATSVCRMNMAASHDYDLIRASFSSKIDQELIFNCYVVTREQASKEEAIEKAERMKEAEESYKRIYIAKERLYESYRKDGKLHSDSYVEPDGTIRSTTIQGDNRCDTVLGSSSANTTCN